MPVLARIGAESGLLLGDECVDLLLHLSRARKAEPRVEPVAPPVDAGPVHRDEQARVRILLSDRGDAGAVERQVRADVDLEEVHRLPVGVEKGRLLPHGPTVVVATRGKRQRLVLRIPLCPRVCEIAREVRVVRLEDDLPVATSIAHDHARAPASSAKCSSTSSSATTSPYFVSIS